MKRFFLILYGCLFINLCIAQTKEGSNGVCLSEIWPPKRSSVYDLENGMDSIPYLMDNKKTVVTINVGRQLFVDDFLIDSTNLVRIHHYPQFYANNPIIKPDKEWENIRTYGAAFAAPFSDGIWYDEEEQKFKMWYMAGGGKFSIQNYGITCFAESEDGINWDKPNLDIIKGTNIVDFNSIRDASVIWLDKQEKNRLERFKMFVVERDSTGKWKYHYKTSKDGLHWTFICSSKRVTDRSTVYKNPFFNKWIFSIRHSIRVASDKLIRGRDYYEHENPLIGTLNAKADIENFWFGSWQNERRHDEFPGISPGIYNHDAIPYESIMLGLFTVWQGPENGYCTENNVIKRNQIMLGYSRDGYHWDRPDMTPFLAVDNNTTAWNNGNMQSIVGVPLIVNDKLYFYASGRHLLTNGQEITTTGLATLRRDGFSSLNASGVGFIITRKLKFDGDYLFVNIDLHNKESSLGVEILDENYKPIEGYTLKDCVSLKDVNSTKQQIIWRNKKNMSPLKGRNIRLKFHLTNGDLYSFWISPWKSGESRGYTAGGGPGLSTSGIDQPLN